MNPAGVLLVVAGVWVTCQVFAGNALQRLNILPKTEGGSTAGPGQSAGAIIGGAIGGAVGGVPAGAAGDAAGKAYDDLWEKTPKWARPLVFPSWYIKSREGK